MLKVPLIYFQLEVDSRCSDITVSLTRSDDKEEMLMVTITGPDNETIDDDALVSLGKILVSVNLSYSLLSSLALLNPNYMFGTVCTPVNLHSYLTISSFRQIIHNDTRTFLGQLLIYVSIHFLVMYVKLKGNEPLTLL